MHTRNRYQKNYDFKKLSLESPALAPFVSKNKFGDLSIEFADPKAVKGLNQALLKSYYSILEWDIPSGYLCPPIPGRADHVHTVADLLAESHQGVVPRGSQIRILDIGVGANCIYPIIGHCEYGWSFVGTDIDLVALKNAESIVAANSKTLQQITFRHQRSSHDILKNVINPSGTGSSGADSIEKFNLLICNPPFHTSLEEAQKGTRRKLKNLGIESHSKKKPKLNFGGQELELWCPGGEVGFIGQLIEESAQYSSQIKWFTALVSKEANLPALHHMLKEVRATTIKTLELSQGQKKSRIIAWSY